MPQQEDKDYPNNDPHNVSVCSDQPKPTGERTEERLRQCGIESATMAQYLADEIKAALTKARLEAHNYWSQAVDSAQQKLTAEREKVDWLKSQLKLSNGALSPCQQEIQQLREQLAAEREKVNILEDSVNDFTRSNGELTTEVLAEREKVQTLVDALKFIRDNAHEGVLKAVATDTLSKAGK